MNEPAIDFSIDDKIARIVFDNAAGHNVIGLEFTRQFADAAVACEGNRDVRAVLIAARGDVFSVGGDLNEFLGISDGLREHVREMATWFHLGVAALNRLAVPVVCAVNGMAAGGGMSIVCMSDYAIATRSAKFNLAYTRTGLTPDGGSTWFLPRLVGVQRAFEIMATNPTLDAEQACSLGLIARVVDDDDFAAETERVLAQFAAAPADAVGRAKQLLRASLGNSLEEQLELEGRAISESASNPETLARLEAFFNRRNA